MNRILRPLFSEGRRTMRTAPVPSGFILHFFCFSFFSLPVQHLTPIDRALSAPALYPVQEECMKKLLCLLLTLCLLTPCAAGLGERHFEGSPWINPELIW